MNWVLGLFLFVLPNCLWAQSLPHGYIQDIQSERTERFYEIFLFAEPPVQEKTLRDRIFNPQLSAEFKSRYRDKFGNIDTDALNYQHNDRDRFEAFDHNTGFSREIIQQDSDRHDFASYMMKRLFEWHLDNYVKSDPVMRPVYELKEKMKKVEVRVNKETKLEFKYDLAGNTMEFHLENPYADTRFEIDMSPTSFGPSGVLEQKLITVKPIDKDLRVENTVYDHDGREIIEFVKTHSANLSSTYNVSAAYKESSNYTYLGPSGETRVGLGMSYAF